MLGTKWSEESIKGIYRIVSATWRVYTKGHSASSHSRLFSIYIHGEFAHCRSQFVSNVRPSGKKRPNRWRVNRRRKTSLEPKREREREKEREKKEDKRERNKKRIKTTRKSNSLRSLYIGSIIWAKNGSLYCCCWLRSDNGIVLIVENSLTAAPRRNEIDMAQKKFSNVHLPARLFLHRKRVYTYKTFRRNKN